MKTLFTQTAICFFTFFISIGTVQAQTFNWVTGGGTVASMSGTGTNQMEQVQSMCTDPNGNIYVLSFVGNDPVTADTFSEISYGVNDNVLLTSYSCNGQMRWAKLLQNNGYGVKPYGIQSDSLGNIYVAGYFDAGGGIMQIGTDTSIGPPASDYVTVGLIRFDTSGNFKWIRYVGNNTLVALEGLGSLADPLTIDGANNVHYFCYMKTGVPLMSGDTSMYGVYDMTYNTGGTLLSAVRLDMDSQWFLHGAVIDPATNKLYVCGEINQYIYGGTLTDTFYAAAFDASRNLLWQYFAGHGDDDGFTGVVLDKAKHLHFSGSAQSTSFATTIFSFNGDSVSNTHYGSDDISVVMTTDTNGTVEWLKHFDCNNSINSFSSITQLPNNKVAVAGTFSGIVSDGTGSLAGPPDEGQNPYIVIVDSAGDIETMQIINEDGAFDGYNAADAITSDRVGNVYVGGAVVDSVYATGLITASYISVGGPSDFFVMKYGVDCSCTSMPVANYTDTGTITIGFNYTGTTASIDSVVWNFGDGTATVTGTTPIHTYTASGTYDACATVYSSCGNDMYCSEITVSLCTTAPVASFSDTGTQTIGFTYTGTTAGMDSVVWSFGDGTICDSMNPIHTYTTAGTYTICVTAYTACGNDTVCSSVVVPPLGVPSLPLANVQVFPNPTNNELYITGIVLNTSYRLLDVTGECMQHGVLVFGSNTLLMKTIAPGIYILEMTGPDGERDIVRVVKE